MGKTLYYEDFTAGQQFHSRRNYTISKESGIAFAKEYDPQLQHVDEAAAQETVLGALIVSGWQTAAATMRLKAETDLVNVAGGLLGLGLDRLRWPRPTMPGDTLHAVITVLDKRLSGSKPDKGIVRYKVETFNQHNELVLEMVAAVIVPKK